MIREPLLLQDDDNRLQRQSVDDVITLIDWFIDGLNEASFCSELRTFINMTLNQRLMLTNQYYLLLICLYCFLLTNDTDLWSHDGYGLIISVLWDRSHDKSDQTRKYLIG